MGVKISELNEAVAIQNQDLLAIVQNGETKKVPAEIIINNVGNVIQKIFTFENVSAMQNASLTTGNVVQTLGYHSANDGGAGLYQIVNDNSLIDNGGSVITLINGLKALLIINNNFMNVKQFGAYGDNTHDDSSVFSTIINYCNQNKLNIFLPNGRYKISQDLPSIYSGIQIVGESNGLTNYNTTIEDFRNSGNFLFEFTSQTNSDVGGLIKDITFNGHVLNHSCININNSSAGWDGLIENVKITNYEGTAFRSIGNDYKILNSMISSCGTLSGNTPVFAVILGPSCNEHKFVNCHFEHCRYIITSLTTAFLNSFDNCKFEMSGHGLTTELIPPIYLTSTQAIVGTSFFNCDFIGIDIENFNKNLSSSFSYDTVPAMITATAGRTNIKNCNFACGAGSGASPTVNNKMVRYINIGNQGSIIGNTFNSCSYLVPSIKTGRALCDENLITIAVPGDTVYTGIASNTRCIIDNILSSPENCGTNNKFIGDTDFVNPYHYYLPYIYHANDQVFNDYMNITGTGIHYATLVLTPTSPASLFAQLDIDITYFGTNTGLRGNLKLDIYHTTGGENNITVKDRSNLRFGISSSIYCFIKNNNIFIQFPVSGNRAINIKASGFEFQQYNAYIDKKMALITDYDFNLEIPQTVS